MSDGRLRVRATPRAARSEIGGWRNGFLSVRVAAPPVDGSANRAVCELIAGRLEVRPTRVRVVAGEKGREKTLEVAGMAQVEVDARLARPPVGSESV